MYRDCHRNKHAGAGRCCGIHGPLSACNQWWSLPGVHGPPRLYLGQRLRALPHIFMQNLTRLPHKLQLCAAGQHPPASAMSAIRR